MAEQCLMFKEASMYVIIPASGLGLRCKMNPPKQFQLLVGRPIISYTISAFESISFVKTIVVTTPTADEFTEKMKQIIEQWRHKKVILTTGANSRHRSIFAGLQCLKKLLQDDNQSKVLSCDPVVIVHDGVRPFVDEESIRNVAIAASKHQAAGIVRPLVSTVLSVDEHNFLKTTLDRSVHWASEMPQGFRLKKIYQAYVKSSEEDLDNGTECLKLVAENAGTKAKILHGNENLWKITHSKDVLLAQHIFLRIVEKRTFIVPLDGSSKDCAKDLFTESWASSVNIKTTLANPRDLNLAEACPMRAVFIMNEIDTWKDSLDNLFQIASFEVAKRPQATQQQIFLVVFCLHQTNSVLRLNYDALRQYIQEAHNRLAKSRIFLYGLVLEKGHDCEPARACISKLLGDANLEFAGQLFYF